MVDLREDCARVAQLWNNDHASRVPLSVAAAFTFHHTRRNGEQALFPDEYAVALDIAAAALACLVPIYRLDCRGEPVPLCVDFARQRFGAGGAEVHCTDGSKLAPLAVVRRDVLPAVLKIERMGVEYVAPRRTRGLAA